MVWVSVLACVLFGFVKHPLGLRVNDSIKEVAGTNIKAKLLLNFYR